MSEEQISPRDFGRIESDVSNLKATVEEIKIDLRAVRDLMEQAKGSWKVIAILGGAAGLVGAGATTMLHWVTGWPK